MKKTLSALMLCLISICFISCSKTTVSDIKFKAVPHDDGFATIYAYHDNDLFSGTVWAEDGRTYCVQVAKNGIVTDVTIFYPDGKKCLSFCPGEPEAWEAYDENGDEMGQDPDDDVLEKFDAYTSPIFMQMPIGLTGY